MCICSSVCYEYTLSTLNGSYAQMNACMDQSVDKCNHASALTYTHTHMHTHNIYIYIYIYIHTRVGVCSCAWFRGRGLSFHLPVSRASAFSQAPVEARAPEQGEQHAAGLQPCGKTNSFPEFRCGFESLLGLDQFFVVNHKFQLLRTWVTLCFFKHFHHKVHQFSGRGMCRACKSQVPGRRPIHLGSEAQGYGSLQWLRSQRPNARPILDCYWVGSLDFNFLGNTGVFH